MKRTRGCAALLFTALAACGNAADSPSRPTEVAARETLVVYASHTDEAAVHAMFATFSEETGIAVAVEFGSADAQVDALIDKTDRPRADVLFQPAVQPLWRAAEEGALRPYRSDSVDAVVPGALRDPDGAWTAVAVEQARILVDSRAVDSTAISGFEYLADSTLGGKLCLTSASMPLNRAVIAQLIETHGRRPAEVIVRGWIANLAQPPFATEPELVAAIAAGTCAAGIVSSSAGRPVIPGFVRQPLAAVTPVPAVVNVEAIGISRHAAHPEAARRLVEWLLSDAVQRRYPADNGRQPAAGADPSTAGGRVGVVGLQDEEAFKLAERAGYR
jgi:iron(III) transport system substrate-binding protein